MKIKLAFGVAFFALGLFALPKISEAATIFVSPASGNYALGQTITVTIRTNTQGSSVNTAEANISYSTDTLELIKISQGSTFYLPAPGSPSKSSGSAYLGGGLPNPGYDGAGGIIGTLVFQAKAQGSATITVTSGKILLNDGFGTNALSGTSGARFSINPPAVGAVVVTSDTHPDSVKWYAGKTVNLSWSRPNGAYGFSFQLDQNENTVPDNELDTTITTSKTYSDLKDGIWYFHIKSRRQDQSAFGAVTHFRVNIDSVAPESFAVKLIGEDANQTGTTPAISFEAADKLSGIDHYTVAINGNEYKASATSPFTFDQLSSGNKNIIVTAYDKAGNSTSSQISIQVRGGLGIFEQLKRDVSMPLYIILLFNLAFLVLLGFVLWLALRRPKRESSSSDPEIKQIQQEIDESLENLKQEISQKLLGLSAKSSEDLFTKETEVAKALRSGVVKTRNKIDKKISRLKKSPKNIGNEN